MEEDKIMEGKSELPLGGGPTLRVFNPGHDIALASGLANFTPPHAARDLQADLGFLPALWANDGDLVLVDDCAYAERSCRRLSDRLCRLGLRQQREVVFVNKGELHRRHCSAVDPWGWDPAIRHYLQRHLGDDGCLPSAGYVSMVRRLSHRGFAARLLQQLTSSAGADRLVGRSAEARTMEQARRLIGEWGKVVLKAPWSSSGRGIRFVDDALSGHQAGWASNVIKTQGALMVEPHYRKVRDFGMEFYADAQGRVHYQGLSLFTTVNGAYTGNLLATERVKREVLSRYVDPALLDEVAQRICRLTGGASFGAVSADAEDYLGHGSVYSGPFGVDMMVVTRDDGDGFLLHPCVEVNLRRTMGHVALALSPHDDDNRRVMSVVAYNGGYKLLVNQASGLGID